MHSYRNPAAHWFGSKNFTLDRDGHYIAAEDGIPGKGASYIVLHTMVGTIASANARFQIPYTVTKNPASAHYGVGMNGSLCQWVDEKDAAWHAGDYDVNLDSIGIEHEDGGKYDAARPTALYKASAHLVAEICRRYKLPCRRGDTHKGISGIVDHRSISATRCPDALDTNRIIADAAAILAGHDPYAEGGKYGAASGSITPPAPVPTPAPTPAPAPGASPDEIEDRGHAAHEHVEVPPMAGTRADVDSLIERIVDLMAKGDGIEPGFLTTEFWLTILAVAADMAGPAIGLSLSGDERMMIAAGLVGVYGAFRAWRKRGGPAKLYADLLARLAELRHAAA